MPQSAEQKRKNVETLSGKRAKRSPQEQLKTLDFRLGKGQGATKERARLQARKAEKKAAKAE